MVINVNSTVKLNLTALKEPRHDRPLAPTTNYYIPRSGHLGQVLLIDVFFSQHIRYMTLIAYNIHGLRSNKWQIDHRSTDILVPATRYKSIVQ